MALHIRTSQIPSEELLDLIRTKIREGRIDTWNVDIDGDFSCASPQWGGQAWFRVASSSNELILGIIGRKDVRMTKNIYGIYHGRFTEMLLTYFDDVIESVEISSQLEEYDFVR